MAPAVGAAGEDRRNVPSSTASRPWCSSCSTAFHTDAHFNAHIVGDSDREVNCSTDGVKLRSATPKALPSSFEPGL